VRFSVLRLLIVMTVVSGWLAVATALLRTEQADTPSLPLSVSLLLCAVLAAAMMLVFTVAAYGVWHLSGEIEKWIRERL
jgi:hypothetical protein